MDKHHDACILRNTHKFQYEKNRGGGINIHKINAQWHSTHVGLGAEINNNRFRLKFPTVSTVIALKGDNITSMRYFTPREI